MKVKEMDQMTKKKIVRMKMRKNNQIKMKMMRMTVIWMNRRNKEGREQGKELEHRCLQEEKRSLKSTTLWEELKMEMQFYFLQSTIFWMSP